MTVHNYIRAMRLPFLTGSLTTVTLAGAYAYTLDRFLLMPFLLTLLGVGLLHIGANTINDYYDAYGTDRVNVRITPFSGGSRAIQEGLVSSGGMLALSLFLFVGAFGVGIGLALYLDPGILVLGMLGFLGGWLYSFGPVRLMSRGWGELTIFLVFGPLLTWGTFYVLAGELTWQAFVLGVPPGFLIAAVIWINQFPDFEADSRTRKRNLVVRLGTYRSRWIYAALMMLPFLTLILMALTMHFSYFILAGFICLPLPLKAVSVAWVNHDSHREIIPAQALTIQTHLALGLLMSGGLILARLLH